MSDYLTKLKTKKQATGVLPKLPKGTLGSKGSTSVGHFSEKNKSNQNQTQPPDLSKVQPENISEYATLWYQACELEYFVDGDAPYPERAAKLPELNRMVERMLALETENSTPPDRLKKIPGIPTDYFQGPAVWAPGPTRDQADRPDKCPACGQCKWWRLNKPNSKWICARCHPPANGLDILWMNKR